MAGEINAPLGGWTTNMPSTGFDASGGIGGDWRFPSMNADPRLLPAPAPAMAMRPRVLRQSAPAAASIAPAAATPNLNVPVGQVAGSGGGSFWDALRALFSGQPQAQASPQGMTGLLQTRGQAGPTTDALGNPFNRFG